MHICMISDQTMHMSIAMCMYGWLCLLYVYMNAYYIICIYNYHALGISIKISYSNFKLLRQTWKHPEYGMYRKLKFLLIKMVDLK